MKDCSFVYISRDSKPCSIIVYVCLLGLSDEA